MTGLAARMAGERYLGMQIDRSKHAADLREALGGLKGPIMKVAQILSTIPDALPPEYAEELASLQADAPAMGWLFTRRRMAAELGPDWQQKLQSFTREAVSAASLGQVHKAVDLDGNELAMKLQYPDMASAIDADLRQLRLVFQLYERYDSAISTSDIYDELSERLREELDYRREAANLKLYRHMLAGEDSVRLPEYRADLSSDRLMTMSWLDGARIMPFLDTGPSQDVRNRIARNMFRVWYVPFYFYGVIHGDPHLGNYSLDRDNRINLMDFGFDQAVPAVPLSAVSSTSTARFVTRIRNWRSTPMKAGASTVSTRRPSKSSICGPDSSIHRYLRTRSGLFRSFATVPPDVNWPVRCMAN